MVANSPRFSNRAVNILAGGWQLSARVSGEAATASLVVRVWAVSRDEPALLGEVIEAK